MIGISPQPSKKKLSQVDLLLELSAAAEVFRTSDDTTAYADIVVDGHRETHKVRGRGYRRWITKRFYEETRSGPANDALQTALNTIEAKVFYEGKVRDVYVRVGSLGTKMYLDLCDVRWRAVEVDEDGWRVVENPPVRFRREVGMLPLPEPSRDGDIAELRNLLNLRRKVSKDDPLNLATPPDEDGFVLVVAWLLAALHPRGPYPILNIIGEPGSAKTTAITILRNIIDPNKSPHRAPPREERDVFIAANHSQVIALDNLSYISDRLSDILCRLATGGGFSTRVLFTDEDEQLFQVTRPILINGVANVVTRPDLADRMILLELERIPDHRRTTEEELWRKFEKAHPKVLGALLDGVSAGLRELNAIEKEPLPRMADFAHRALACEQAGLWPKGEFMRAFKGNQNAIVAQVLADDLVADALRRWMDIGDRECWTGSAKDLLIDLNKMVEEHITRNRDWPRSPRAMSGKLRYLAAPLRRFGIEVVFPRKGDRDRLFTIDKVRQ